MSASWLSDDVARALAAMCPRLQPAMCCARPTSWAGMPSHLSLW